MIALAPIALIVSLCAGMMFLMMFFMMRGMHGGVEGGSAHGKHGEQQTTGAGETERLTQLESEVDSLREQAEIATKGSNGRDPATTAPDFAGTKSDS